MTKAMFTLQGISNCISIEKLQTLVCSLDAPIRPSEALTSLPHLD